MAAPTIILALDGADDLMLKRYAAAGELPFLSQFVKNWRTVKGPHHFCEMGAWATFWSGIPIVEHGYHCIRRLVPGTYEVELTSGPARPCAPFWTKQRGSVSIWDPQEVEPDRSVRGEQLCNWRTSSSDRCMPTPASEPAALLDEVVAKYGPPGRPVPIDLADTPASREANFRLSSARIATCGRLFRDALRRREHDFYLFGCAELHSATHLCWTGDADGERRMLAHHRSIDRELAQLIDGAPAGSRVLLCSAYGMYPSYPLADAAERVLRALGYQQTKRRRSARTLIPEAMRRKIGNWLPTQTQEKLINRHLADDTDWSRSVAFGMPTLYTGYVRINLKGREPRGIVEPGDEYRQVVEQIAEDFSRLESPRVAKIRRMADLCAGRPPERVPDLVISWAENDRPWDEIVHPRFRAPLPRHQFHRSTYHSYRGFLASLDADLLDGIPEELDIPDVAGHLARIHGRQPVGTPM